MTITKQPWENAFVPHSLQLPVTDRLDFRRSLESGLPSLRKDGWTRERQTMSVTSIPN